ncbi:regulator [Caulobacter sp. Root1455]|uniref:response regulator n=1 Tax=unclassified Caulobacter TaxID=2648921 RepID=UPI0006F39CC9|nr:MULTISPECIES: response regulator [unclassified Caulobacter]KQY29953.1 regulator [Caulobacter sp. Root487D2Y]KQY92252.1 regulator [Caulobacter sp. Root1455]
MILAASPDTPARPRLLLVEDDPGVRRALQLLLRGRGFDVRAYAVGAALIADLQAQMDAVALVADFKMPQIDGVALLTALRAAGWNGPALLITGFPSREVEARARAAGYALVIEKPLVEQTLGEAVERMIAAAARTPTTY